GEPGVVIDDRVAVVVADPGPGAHPIAGALRAIAGHPVPGALKARVARRVHVQEIPGAGPLVADHLLAGGPRRPREPVSGEGAVDGRVGMAGLAGDQPRPPAGP